jgi:hypothetical protein
LDVPVAIAGFESVLQAQRDSVLPKWKPLFEITSRKNCCFVSNEAQIYAYVQHELINARDLLKCKKHW